MKDNDPELRALQMNDEFADEFNLEKNKVIAPWENYLTNQKLIKEFLYRI
jgi:hypothetical protein